MCWGSSFLTFAYIQFVLLGAPTISSRCSSHIHCNRIPQTKNTLTTIYSNEKLPTNNALA